VTATALQTNQKREDVTAVAGHVERRVRCRRWSAAQVFESCSGVESRHAPENPAERKSGLCLPVNRPDGRGVTCPNAARKSPSLVFPRAWWLTGEGQRELRPACNSETPNLWLNIKYGQQPRNHSKNDE